jgi:protoheme IX farnesyltransferase
MKVGAHTADVATATERHRVTDFVALTKPRLNLLVLMTTLAGLYLAAPSGVPFAILVHTLVGTALVAGGAAALNQVWERKTDRVMRRTADRPIPGGRLRAGEGTTFGVLLAVVGLAELAWAVNVMSAVVAGATLVSYVLVYTPLKPHTSLATLIGAIPGALPPVIGWAAATGEVTLPASVLFGIVFLWQMPHFLAIAWMHRGDYAAAGIPLLPVLEPDGRRTGQQALLYAAALLPVSLLPVAVGLADVPYVIVATSLGVGFIWLAASFARHRSIYTARGLFLFSITYLPILLVALVVDRVWIGPDRHILQITDLPALNASLNGLSTLFLVSGYVCIRGGRRELHKKFMLAALVTSALFLTSYVIYHANAGSRPFPGEGTIRAVYFAILIPHVILAATVLPLALVTTFRGLRSQFDRHVRIARWTLPIWLYVSVTGVVIYVMLYRLY